MIGNRLAEGDARLEPLAHFFERRFGNADSAHAVMDSARPKAALGDFEAATFAEQQVRYRYANIFQFDFHMAMRRIVISKDREVANDVHAFGIGRHQDLRLLLVAIGFKVRLAHHDRHFAARIAKPRRPPFAAIDDIFIAIPLDLGLDIGGVGRSDSRFGHQEGRTDLAIHQRAQPGLFLLQRAIAMQHFHIAGVRRGAVEAF